MAPNLAPAGNNNSNFWLRRPADLARPNAGAQDQAGANSAGSSSTSSSGASASSSGTKSCPIQKYLINCKSIYSCIYCRTNLANHDELVSRSFQGNYGRAYLFNSVINITCGPAVQRELATGSHAVSDISCENCQTVLGWRYEKAFKESEKYKEGKYIIELAHVVRENKHLELDKGQQMLLNMNSARKQQAKLCQSYRSTNSPSASPTNPNWRLSDGRNSSTLSNDCRNKIINDADENRQDEDEDELMFVFYDDFSSNNSSYSNSFSTNHHNKIRRSLYLDSTPYDWKYYTNTSTATDAPTSSSSSSSSFSSSAAGGTTTTDTTSQKDAPPESAAAAAAKATDSINNQQAANTQPQPPTCPSAGDCSTRKPERAYQIENSFHINADKDLPAESYGEQEANLPQQARANQEPVASARTSQKQRAHEEEEDEEDEEEEEDDHEETQFKFEADRQETSRIDQAGSNRCNLDGEQKQARPIMKQCDLEMHSGTRISACSPSCSSSSEQEAVVASHDGLNSATKNTSTTDPDKVAGASANCDDPNGNHSISLDDEEFYDCFTDHDITQSS